MLTNAQIKLIRSLREKKYRDELGLFIVEGEKMVSEAQKSGFQIQSLIRVEEEGEKTMEKISLLSSPSPVLAVLRKRNISMPEINGGALFLALDRVSDPGNLGTIIRIADWFGIEGIIASEDTVEEYNPKVVQASMGSIFRVPVYRKNLKEACALFENIYGTFLDGENIYSMPLKSSNTLIIMGNESNGISGELKPLINNKLYIPSWGSSKAESLNVAVATAVTVAEFRRRG